MKIKNKIWILLLVGLWGLAGYQFLEGNMLSEDKGIVEVFQNLGSKTENSVVEYYGVCDKQYGSTKEQEELLKEIAKQLNITRNYQLERSKDEQRQEVRLTKQAKSAKTTLRFISVKEADGMKQYMIARITLDGGMETGVAHKKQLDDLLKKYSSRSRCSANLIIAFNGKLTLQERNQIADNMLGKMGASVVTEHRTMELYTIYAYTHYFKEYVMQEDKEVNMNIAMHYNGEDGKTYVYVATPIVGLDY